jgi:glycine hydroxymethyltransferase
VPFHPEKPMVTSGIRVGTPAGTTRGFGVTEFEQVGDFILEILDGLQKNPEDNSAAEASVREKVIALCNKFPIY